MDSHNLDPDSDHKQFSVNIFTDDCPCGSGTAIGDCCFADVNTSPSPPRTGFSHPGCYARQLGDCSETISGEHYISKGLLDLMGPGRMRTVSGAPWLPPGASKDVSIASLQSKILCKRHNEALAGLDALAGRVFQYVLFGVPNTPGIIVRGTVVEKWLLKVFCGFLASGNAVDQDRAQISPMEPMVELLDTLFQGAPVPDGCGLSCPLKAGGPGRVTDLRAYIMSSADVGPFGCGIQFGFVHFLFTTGMVTSSPRSGPEDFGLAHHPKCLMIRGSGLSREIHFGWPDGEEITVEVEVSAPND